MTKIAQGPDGPDSGPRDPLVPVLGGKNRRSWPKHETGGHARYMPLSEALTREFRCDAHAAAYSVPEKPRRLGKQALSLTTAPPIVVPIVRVLFDIDDSSHKSVGGTGTPLRTDDWWLAEVPKIERLRERHPGAFVYRTRGGYRIVYLLALPVLLASEADAENWRVRYLAWVAYLRREFDIHADPSCAPWMWLFRLPHATRDEGATPERRETIGDPSNIGVWDVVPAAEDVAAAEQLRKRKSKKRSARREEQSVQCATSGDGVLFHAFTTRNWLGPALEPGKWAVVCPNDAAHTRGERFDTSTVLYAPGAGEALGWVHCSHAHCHGRTSKDVLGAFSKEEIDAARAAAGVTTSSTRTRTSAQVSQDLPEHLEHVLKNSKLQTLLNGGGDHAGKSPRSVDHSFVITAALLGVTDAADLERLLRHRLHLSDRDGVAGEPGYVDETVQKALTRSDEIHEEALDPLLRGFRIVRRVPEGGPEDTNYRISGPGWTIDLRDRALTDPKVVVCAVLQQTGQLAAQPKRADWEDAVRRALKTRTEVEVVSPEHSEVGLLKSFIARWLVGALPLTTHLRASGGAGEAEFEVPWPHRNEAGEILFTIEALVRHLGLQAGLRDTKHDRVLAAVEKLGATYTQRRVLKGRPRVWVITAERLAVNTGESTSEDGGQNGRDAVDTVDRRQDRASAERPERHTGGGGGL